MRSITLVLMILLLLCTSVLMAEGTPADTPAQVSKTATTKNEAELGKETAKQIEKDYKLVNDEKMLAKLNQMAAEIAPHTQRPDVVYTIKILDIHEINAMAIPGGTIYFTKGLINAAESDDELAGVMAHEIAHNALYHSKQMMERERRALPLQILSTLAVIFVKESSGQGSDVSSVQLIAIGEMVKQSILNGYTKDLENEADLNAARYLQKVGKYNPVGLYSVILGFRQMERSEVKIDYGYLQNHPDPEERLINIKKELVALQVPINLWSVINFRATMVPPKEGETGFLLKLGSIDLLTLTAPDGEKDARARVTAAMDAINQSLTKKDQEISRFDVRVSLADDDNRAIILLRKTPVLALLPADVNPNNGTLMDLAAQVKMRIQSAILEERVKRGMDASTTPVRITYRD